MYLVLLLLLSVFLYCRNSSRNNSVEVAKESNEQKGGVSKEQSDFLVDAYSSGLLEVALGDMAKQKAQAKRLKRFAGEMAQMHRELNDELKKLATQKQLTISADLTTEQQKQVNELKAKWGLAFDDRCLSLMVDEHQKSVDQFEKASRDYEDADVQLLAAKMLPKLKAHLDSAKMIQAALPKLKK